ncbi:hypothetical protein [Maribacter sp. 2307UL18-2]|uniref:hypothetical protein n=1 Tax=Maribacter sp. 2307UL18-2 TaxID=3386274 RepID=UPI0039BD7947
MKRTLKSFGMLACLFAITSLSAQTLRKKAIQNSKEPKTLNEVKDYAVGQWKSIAVELRPTEDRTGTGTVTPSYLRRDFTFEKDDTFTGIITLYGDNYGKLPLMEFEFKGHLEWGDEHPIADGAWKIDYVLDQGFGVTPLNPQAAQMLNQALPKGMSAFEANKKKDILQKEFPMFNIVDGQIVSDYDLIYFKNGMLFMGAKHVDGTPFDKPENRPHQLQIPLERVYK